MSDSIYPFVAGRWGAAATEAAAVAAGQADSCSGNSTCRYIYVCVCVRVCAYLMDTQLYLL